MPSAQISIDQHILLRQHLAATLQPTLLSTFLDCAPAAFSPAGNPPENELQMALVISQIARSLYSSLLQVRSDCLDNVWSNVSYLQSNGGGGKDAENLTAILGYMSPYFPFSTSGGLASAKRDIKVISCCYTMSQINSRLWQVESTFETLNLIYCEMTSLLVLASASPAPSISRRAATTRNNAKKPAPSALAQSGGTPLQVDRVKAYVTQLLRGELPRGSNTQTTLPHPISHTSYSALLPAIWALISTPSQGQHPDELLIALIDHALKASSGSGVKKDTVQLVGLLALVSHHPSFFRVPHMLTSLL